MSRLKDICFDCADAPPLADWWAGVLGYQVRGRDDPKDPDRALDPIGEAGPSFWFNQVPEPKTVKNRVHIDVFGDVDELVAKGATVLDRLERWTVMADPEGNEFCVFPPT